MILEPFSQHLKSDNIDELLAPTQDHNKIDFVNIRNMGGIDLHHYHVHIPGMEGKPDRWDVSLATVQHKPNEHITLIGFGRNGDYTGESSDFAASGPNFVRHALPKILAHHHTRMKKSGKIITAFTMGAEDINPDRVRKKQKVYQSMFSNFEPDTSVESKNAGDLFKSMANKPKEMPMFSFGIPRHLTII
jgi:hypothetical protein